jgi:hypothetical protein
VETIEVILGRDNTSDLNRDTDGLSYWIMKAESSGDESGNQRKGKGGSSGLMVKRQEVKFNIGVRRQICI